MDPLITNGIDPGLLRVIEKRGQERDREPRRKRPAPEMRVAAVEAEAAGKDGDNDAGPDDAPKHMLDDLA